MKVFIFNGDNDDKLEKEIQDLLTEVIAENPMLRVRHVTQSESLYDSCWSLTITVIMY